MPVTIVSRDKDLTQLVSARDTYWDAIADVRYGTTTSRNDLAQRPSAWRISWP